MATVLIDDKSQEGSNVLEHPHVGQIVNEYYHTPLPEVELMSLKEFKSYMEELAYKRFRLDLTL